MFERRIQNQLHEWAEKNNRKPLILRGARQVGKTTIVEQFGKEFDNFLSLNLEKKEAKDLFESTDDVKMLLPLLFLYPRAYGVVEFDANSKAVSLEEKPANPKSNYAVPGLYFYDSTVTEKAASLKPSARGEYELTDLNRLYLDEGTLKVELFGRGFAWLDTGNCDSLLEASNFVATIQNRQGFRVSCIEEIAWRKGWIDVDQLYRLGEQLGKTEYGKYLMELAESKR